MPHRVDEPMHLGMAIYELTVEAHNDTKRDRRSEVRYPFFRPLSIRVDGKCYSAFSREICTSGIGLLHNFEPRLGEVEISIPSQRGWLVRVRTRIVWCRPCGEGWYISGGDFIGVGRAGP
ncbi:MAG: PilZ domain-containing protein [Planctomycetia bacterium]|nr:PilZ domain-containing protein [Planctomycetia bacterium]